MSQKRSPWEQFATPHKRARYVLLAGRFDRKLANVWEQSDSLEEVIGTALSVFGKYGISGEAVEMLRRGERVNLHQPNPYRTDHLQVIREFSDN